MTKLDTILRELRTELPAEDEIFVGRVMREVRKTDQSALAAWKRWLRRPLVVGVVAAGLATSGAVAAIVQTTDDNNVAAPKTSASVQVTATPSSDASSEPSASPARQASGQPPAPIGDPTSPVTPGSEGEHTSYVVDAKTGLALETEAHTGSWAVGTPQRVTLTLTNTGEYPIAMSSPHDCGLQAVAAPATLERVPTAAELPLTSGALEWECAGSQADPKTQIVEEQWALAPGESRTADAQVTLRSAGDWSLVGMCRCSYRQVRPASPPPVTDVTGPLGGTLPSQVIPQLPDGANLTTPPLNIRAD